MHMSISHEEMVHLTMDLGAVLRPESTSLDTRLARDFTGLKLIQEGTDDRDLLCEGLPRNQRRGRASASRLGNLLETDQSFAYVTRCVDIFYNAIALRNFPMATAILHRGIFTTTHPSTEDQYIFEPWWTIKGDSVTTSLVTASMMEVYLSTFFKTDPHQAQIVEWKHDGKVRRVRASIDDIVYENRRTGKQLVIYPGGREFYTDFGDISLLDTTRQNLERYLQVYRTVEDFEKQLHLLEMNFFLTCIANDTTLHTEHADTVISTYKHLIDNTSFHIRGKKSTLEASQDGLVERHVMNDIKMVVFEDLYDDNYSSIVKEGLELCCFDRFVPGIEQRLRDEGNYQLRDAWSNTLSQHEGWKYDLKIEFLGNMIFLSEYNVLSERDAVREAVRIWILTQVDTFYKLVRWVIYRHKGEGDQKIEQEIVSFDVIVEARNTVEKQHIPFQIDDKIVVMRYDIENLIGTREKPDILEEIVKNYPDGDDMVMYWLYFDAEKGDDTVEDDDESDVESIELGEEDTESEEENRRLLELLEPY